MNKKLFLTSAIALVFACPAMAEHQTSNSFPNDGYMQEDYTYTNQANYTNMGVYEGSVSAEAEYEMIPYTLTAGKYLPAASVNPATQCLAGSYCPGLQNQVYYNEDSAQGIESCPNGFGNSAAGSTSDTQCYRTCDIANMGANGTIADIPHAATLTGNDYYGNGTDTCEPATCVAGWHLKQGLNLTSAIGNGEGENSAYVSGSGSFREFNYDDQGAKGQSYYGINGNNTWAVDYGSTGMLIGQGRCSTRGVTTPWYETWDESTDSYTFPSDNIVSSLTDETGQEGAQYCYCNVTGYTPASGTLQSVSSSWVFKNGYGDASDCASDCANLCAAGMRFVGAYGLAFRAALLGSVAPGLASCEANTITINWSDVDPQYANQNNEGTATYGGNINTPFKAATKPGKTFTGWRFVKPSNNNNG